MPALAVISGASQAGPLMVRTVGAIQRFVPGIGNVTRGTWQGRPGFFANIPSSALTIVRRVVNDNRIRALFAAFGGLQIVESFTPGDTLPLVPPFLGIENPGNASHPAQIVKEGTANGVPMVKLANGQMGAYSKKRGSWKYWRPKKPIVLYSGGSSNLRTLLRADNAAEKQLRRLKKAIDRRFPPRRNSRRRAPQDGQTVILETGPGSVQRT